MSSTNHLNRSIGTIRTAESRHDAELFCILESFPCPWYLLVFTYISCQVVLALKLTISKVSNMYIFVYYIFARFRLCCVCKCAIVAHELVHDTSNVEGCNNSLSKSLWIKIFTRIVTSARSIASLTSLVFLCIDNSGTYPLKVMAGASR